MSSAIANTRRNKDHLKLCSINICGLSARSKLVMDNYNYIQNCDIIAIQETNTDKVEQLNLNNMKMISDTNKAKNLGAALYVKSDYTITKLPEISKLSQELDSTWGLAVIKNIRYIVGSIYVKLKVKTAIVDTIKMLKAAQEMTRKLKANGIILAGDFNARHQIWGDGTSNEYGRQLADLLDNKSFSIIAPTTPTFLCENGSSFIDLMVVSNNLVNKIDSCITDDEIELFSGAPIRGHVPVIMEMKTNRDNTATVVTKKLDIDSIKWGNWTEDIESKLERDQADIEGNDDPYMLWNYIDKVVTEVTKKHCATKKSTKHSKPYWTHKLSLLCDTMRAARITISIIGGKMDFPARDKLEICTSPRAEGPRGSIFESLSRAGIHFCLWWMQFSFFSGHYNNVKYRLK